MINKHLAFVSLGICLLGGQGVAQADDSARDSKLFLCGTTASRQTRNLSQDYVHRYIIGSLPVAVSGEGVGSDKDIALVMQTEPEEQDSVYNVEGDMMNPHHNSIDPDPEPTIRQGNEPETQYKSNPEKNMHSEVALAYFSDVISGVTSPAVLSQDNSFGVSFNAETKKEGAMSKYFFDLNYNRRISQDWEFGCSWTPLTWNAKHSGFDNGSVSLKYQIFKNSTNALAVSGAADFPTGTPTFSDVGILPSLKLSYSYYLPEKWSITGNLTSQLSTNTDHSPSYLHLKYVLQVGKAFDKDFFAINFGGDSCDALHGVCKNYVDAFYSRTLAPDQSLSFMVRKGLTGGKRTDWKFVLGYDFTF